MNLSITQFLFSTVRLELYEGKEEIEAHPLRRATGFFIKVPILHERSFIYLVTCKHVFEDANHMIMHLLRKNKETNQPLLGSKLPIEIDGLKNIVELSANPSVDIAIVNVTNYYKENENPESVNNQFKKGKKACRIKEGS